MASLTDKAFASDGFQCPTHGRSEFVACRMCLLESLEFETMSQLLRNTPEDRRREQR